MLKKLMLTLLIGLSMLIGCGLLLIKTMAGQAQSIPPILTYQHNVKTALPPIGHDNEFTLLSLNLAHGRGNGTHQISQTTPQICTNLDAVITVLNREQPDLVAVQEADGPSLWSGRFSHVAYIARNAGYSYAIRGTHVTGLGLDYGTGLLSRQEIKKSLSMTFPPTPPTLTKGFTMATIQIHGTLAVDVVSVHLDFFSKRNRLKQIRTLITELDKRHNPLIIMGDFNNNWQNGSGPKIIAQKLNLTTFQPENNGLITFPALHKRIDFILVSKEFTITSYTTLPDILSDHLAVLARIKLH